MTYDDVVDYIDEEAPYWMLPAEAYDWAAANWDGRNSLSDIISQSDFLRYFDTEDLTYDDKILYGILSLFGA